MWEVIAKWLPWVMLFVLFTALLVCQQVDFWSNV